MDNVLENLNSEELGILFPIILVAHNPAWPEIFLEEKKTVTNTLDKESIISLEHIGSTAIPGIMAKPTIDILMIIGRDLDVIALS